MNFSVGQRAGSPRGQPAWGACPPPHIRGQSPHRPHSHKGAQASGAARHDFDFGRGRLMPLARLPFAIMQAGPSAFFGLTDLFVLACVLYDLITLKRIHRTTALVGLFIVASQPPRLLLGGTRLARLRRLVNSPGGLRCDRPRATAYGVRRPAVLCSLRSNEPCRCKLTWKL
jgi:hypothetical protein